MWERNCVKFSGTCVTLAYVYIYSVACFITERCVPESVLSEKTVSVFCLKLILELQTNLKYMTHVLKSIVIDFDLFSKTGTTNFPRTLPHNSTIKVIWHSFFTMLLFLTVLSDPAKYFEFFVRHLSRWSLYFLAFSLDITKVIMQETLMFRFTQKMISGPSAFYPASWSAR